MSEIAMMMNVQFWHFILSATVLFAHTKSTRMQLYITYGKENDEWLVEVQYEVRSHCCLDCLRPINEMKT